MKYLLLGIILVTVGLELGTVLMRYKFGSVRKSLHKWKIPFHIHHGYIGTLLIIFYFIFYNDWFLLIGAPLLISDFIHHFIVLELWKGRSEFP